MLEQAAESKLGIKLVLTIVSIIAYADDVMLLADCPVKAQQLSNIVGEQGAKDDILFNPKKSGILSNDMNKPDIFLNGEKLRYDKNMKYLGVQLNQNGTSHNHIKVTKRKGYAALSMLRSLGLISQNLSMYSKSFLFREYIRPVILYGLDVFDLNKEEIENIRKTETMVLKQLLGIKKQVHNTAIMLALSIEQTENLIQKSKLNLLTRLLENKYTEKILIETNQINRDNSFVTTVSEIVNIGQPNEIDLLVKSSSDKLIDLVMDEDKLRKTANVRELDLILKIKNRSEFLTKLWASQGFKVKKITNTECYQQQIRSN